MHVCEVYIALTLGAHIRSPGAGIKDGYEPPEVGTGNQTWVLGKSSVNSWLNPSPQILLLLF